MQWYLKYLISSFIVIVCWLQQYCLAQTTTVRPYKFGFTIEEQQHRYEKRDERGIVMGEFGFITADGIYHVTVYATDEQGRFRILAMKNYPYESPPKTVEVMVKPKVIKTTTTTTEKPVLTRHNFNTEACSGCFLKNGNNKPKSLNGVDNKNLQAEIRPLSKSLPSTPSNVARQPGLSGTQPKLASNNPGNSGKPSNTPDKLLKPTTTPTKFVTSQYVTTHQQHVAKYTPTTLSESLKTNVAKPLSTLAHNSQSIPAVKINTKSNQQHLFDSTTKSVIQNIQNTLKTKTTLNNLHNTPLNTDSKHTKTLDSTETAHIPTVVTKILENTAKQPTLTSKHVTTHQQHAEKYTPTKLSESLDINVVEAHSTQSHGSKHIPTVTINKNKDQRNLFDTTTKSVIKNLQNPLKTKTNNILHNLTLNTKSKQDNTLISAESGHVLTVDTQIIENTAKLPSLATKSNKKGNTPIPTLQNPLKTKTNNILHNLPLNTESKQDNTLISAESGHIRTVGTQIIENTAKQPSLATKANKKGNTPIPTTTNTNTGNTKAVRTQTQTGFGKQYDTPTFSKDTNPTTTNRPQGSPGLTTKSNTPTGKTPPIMDIIVKKILPALMGTNGKSPTTSTKPSATPSSSNSPGSTKTLIPGSNSISNPQSRINKGNSNPSSINGDGDLYRFKYILDYHGHTETGKRNGNKEGNYFVIGDDDVERTIEYVANENGYQPHIRWRKLNQNEIKSKENTLKDYEFVWFTNSRQLDKHEGVVAMQKK